MASARMDQEWTLASSVMSVIANGLLRKPGGGKFTAADFNPRATQSEHSVGRFSFREIFAARRAAAATVVKDGG